MTLKYRITLKYFREKWFNRYFSFLPYFSDYKKNNPKIGEENGGASYSLNAAYLARGGGGGGGAGFFPIFLL